MIRIISSIFLVFILLSSCNETEETDSIYIKHKEKKIINHVDEEKILKIDCKKQFWQYENKGLYQKLLKSKVDSSDLKFLPPSILRFIRNEIYAKYCYKFKSKDLQQYFLKYSWYVPNFDNVDSLLTPIDLHNISLIKQFEKKNEYIQREELFDLYLKNIEEAPLGLKLFFIQSSDMRIQNSAATHIFVMTKNIKYILYEYFYGCDYCPSDLFLLVYKNDGTIINSKDFGKFAENETGDFFIKSYPDSVILADIKRELKPEYKDSLEYDECSDKYYGKDYFYNCDTAYTKIFLLKNEDFEIKVPK